MSSADDRGQDWGTSRLKANKVEDCKSMPPPGQMSSKFRDSGSLEGPFCFPLLPYHKTRLGTPRKKTANVAGTAPDHWIP